MFKDRLVALRKEKNLSQSQLGEILSITQRSLSRLETGETFPDEQLLNDIADFFNVSVDYLMDRTNIKDIYNWLGI
ncbi:helix-turn-helix domain-containing protein [Romboutsia sp. 1001285H_161024_C4]|uniref:helix-turn-helix domain-containing protein n=1 Tax=Romboutsia sp. 1001285H_161024_C4 TaxID=2787109 RepID=UPI001A9B89EF|nr:helix-turn-helix transcriptional regulator [Romboutsia sp. 1001285H_161024_C4]